MTLLTMSLLTGTKSYVSRINPAPISSRQHCIYRVQLQTIPFFFLGLLHRTSISTTMSPFEMLENLQASVSVTLAGTLRLAFTIATAIGIVIMALLEILEIVARVILFPFTFVTFAFVAAILAPFDPDFSDYY
jgi:hypothetical protein